MGGCWHWGAFHAPEASSVAPTTTQNRSLSERKRKNEERNKHRRHILEKQNTKARKRCTSCFQRSFSRHALLEGKREYEAAASSDNSQRSVDLPFHGDGCSAQPSRKAEFES